MSWNDGATLFADIIEACVELEERGMTHELRYELYTRIIHLFEETGCDTLHELTGEGIDEAFDEAWSDHRHTI